MTKLERGGSMLRPQRAARTAGLLLFGFACLLPWPMPAQDILTVQALVEKREVFAGEPFVLQIRVDGSDSPEEPDLSALKDFTVRSLGGSQNSSESVTIVNGRVNRVVQRGYIWSYQLTASREGQLTISAITVRAGGRSARTQPVPIRVARPQESQDFKLRLSLSESSVYVGQPVTLTITWYVGRNVTGFTWDVPVLADSRFSFGDIRIQVDPERHIQIPTSAGELIAEKSRAALDGREFLAVTAKKILIPRQPGSFTLPEATVAGQAVRGFQRRRSPFGDFFDDDFFGFGRQPVVESFAVPSNRLTLQVRELPSAGRPAGFSGLVGEYRIKSEAAPTEVNVGDPITLHIDLSGPGDLGNAELPPLENQPEFAGDFKIPPERAAGVIEGRAKRFTQTIRAMHAGVSRIPPVELSYFNPKSGAYEVARTEPIPLVVRGTRILTASDIEGAGDAETVGRQIESREEGIAHNYEDAGVLVTATPGLTAWFQRPAWLAALGAPPAVYLGTLGWVLYGRWRRSDPAGRRSRKALDVLSRRLRGVRPANTDDFYSATLGALREYLGAKLGMAAGALTFRDVQAPLAAAGLGEPLLAEWKRLFDRCEAGRYAGAAFGDEEPASLAAAVLAAARQTEGALK